MTVAIDINPSAAAEAYLSEARAKRGQLTRRKSWRPARELAVDLGTANTLVFVKGEGVVLNEPSVAAVDQATGKILGIGLECSRISPGMLCLTLTNRDLRTTTAKPFALRDFG